MLSMWTDIYYEKEPVEAVEMLLSSPFRAFEFGCTHFEQWLKDGEDEGVVRTIVEMMETSGAHFVQMHAPIFNFLQDERAEEKMTWTERALHLAPELGIDWVVVHPGTRSGWCSDPEVARWVREQNVEIFRRWSGIAESLGTGIAIENMNDPTGSRGRRFGAIVEDLLWLLGEIGSDHAGVCWDTGHAALQYGDQLPALKAVKNHIVATHIADNHGAADDHLYPCRGTINWSDIVPLLKELPVPFNFEVPGERKGAPLPVRGHQVDYGYRLGSLLWGEDG